MRRADRLFQIIQVLRRTRKPLTADAIAAELETSKRTIYRDIATLIEQRVPIRGEAGMGYILEKGFDLPPLMLTPDEIEACVLGAQWVVGPRRSRAGARRAGPDGEDRRHRARAPAALRARARQPRPAGLEPGARPHRHGADARADPRRQEDHAATIATNTAATAERTIWPIAVGYHEAVRILAAWCELRKDFRSFRTDRVIDAVYHDEKYPERRDLLRARWRRSLVWEAPKDT